MIFYSADFILFLVIGSLYGFYRRKLDVLASWFIDKWVDDDQRIPGPTLGVLSSHMGNNSPLMHKLVDVGGGLSSHCVDFGLASTLLSSTFIQLNKRLNMHNVERGQASHNMDHGMVSKDN